MVNSGILNGLKDKKTSIERVHPEGRKLSFEIADAIDNLDIDGVYLLKKDTDESNRYYKADRFIFD